MVTELPSKIFKPLKKLKKLNLQKNYLKTLDKDIFKDLLNLEELDLSYNSIESLHVDLFDMNRKIASLDLRKSTKEPYCDYLKCILSSYGFDLLKQRKINDLLPFVKLKNLKFFYPDNVTKSNPARANSTPARRIYFREPAIFIN